MHLLSRSDLDDVAAVRAYLDAHIIRGDADACDLWAGIMTVYGYGHLHVYSGGKRRSARAHRMVYLLAYGRLTPGLHVRHKVCGNRACCKLAHLEEGTARDNEADKARMGRTARGDRSGIRLHPESAPRGDQHYSRVHPERLARGERNAATTISRATAYEIKKLLVEHVPMTEIARRVEASYGAVTSIKYGRSWVELPYP